jgi:hypothetical protein
LCFGYQTGGLPPLLVKRPDGLGGRKAVEALHDEQDGREQGAQRSHTILRSAG